MFDRFRESHDVFEVALEFLDHHFPIVVVAELNLPWSCHKAPDDRGLENVEQVVELTDVYIADEAADWGGKERVGAACFARVGGGGRIEIFKLGHAVVLEGEGRAHLGPVAGVALLVLVDADCRYLVTVGRFEATERVVNRQVFLDDLLPHRAGFVACAVVHIRVLDHLLFLVGLFDVHAVLAELHSVREAVDLHGDGIIVHEMIEFGLASSAVSSIKLVTQIVVPKPASSYMPTISHL